MYSRTSQPRADSYLSSPRNSSPLRNKASYSFYSSPAQQTSSPRLSSPKLNSTSYVNNSLRYEEIRLRDQEYSHERTVAHLRGQISGLRQQLDASASAHLLQISRQKEELERRFNGLRSSKDQQISSLKKRLEALSFLSQNAVRDQKSAESRCASLSAQVSELRNLLNSARAELDYFKVEATEKNRRQIEALENEISAQSSRSNYKIDLLETDSRKTILGLQEALRSKEEIIRTLESDNLSLRRDAEQRSKQANRQMYSLEQKLGSLQSAHGAEMERARGHLDAARHEIRAARGESGRLDIELKKTRRENNELSDEIRRLRGGYPR